MPVGVEGSEAVAARPQLWRITDRRTFEELRRRGRRARRGPLTVTWAPPAPGSPSEPPRAGFAVGKTAGGAVVRNRVRRRLRAALRELRREGGLPAGAYLVGATGQAATMPWSDLLECLRAAVAEVQR